MTLSPDRMRREADVEALVAQVSALGGPALWQRGPDGGRAYLDERAAAAPGPAVGKVRDLAAPNSWGALPLRVYRPAGDADGLPVVAYLHGGGFVVGSLDSFDAFCRRLVLAASCVVVSVGYRLAPEHPFPAGVDDAEAGVRFVAEHAADWGADASRLVVLGDSAGGNLATVALLRLGRAGGPPVARQVLAYPVTDGRRTGGSTPFGHAWPLTDRDLDWFLEQYVPDPARRSDPEVSPVLADEPDLARLPRTTLVLGGCDPLFAEGMAYAERLWSAGVELDLHVYPGQLHGFVTFDPALLCRSSEVLRMVAGAIACA